MQNSEIHSYKDIKNKILEAVEEFSQPIIGTLTPSGQNVILQTKDGLGWFTTKDGVTIAKHISFEDPVKNAVGEFLKHAALKTVYEVGDGTTTSVLLARAFIKEGFKLLDAGWNSQRLIRELDIMGKQVLSNIEKMSYKIKDDKDLKNVALISSNNDEEIAENTIKAIKSAGLEGTILIEDSPKNETEVQTEEGFIIDNGMFSPHFSNIKGKFMAQYPNDKGEDFRILVMDKRIYYPEEAIVILKITFKAGIKNIVIVASDFIGTAPNTFLTNHLRGNMGILLVKAPDEETLEDLASYLGTQVISEKKGDLSTNLTIEDFGEAKKVMSDAKKTLILNKNKKTAEDRVLAIREEIKNAKDEKGKERLEKRLARMTSGTVTLYVGGRTAPEMREKMFRYEDAISATKAAMRSGYCVGGGITLAKSYIGLQGKAEILQLFNKVCLSQLEQLAINCDLHYQTLLEKVSEGEKTFMGMKIAEYNLGYNVSKNQYSDLLQDGVIEPLEVIRQAFSNALSVANIILSSKFIISLCQKESTDEKKKP